MLSQVPLEWHVFMVGLRSLLSHREGFHGSQSKNFCVHAKKIVGLYPNLSNSEDHLHLHGWTRAVWSAYVWTRSNGLIYGNSDLLVAVQSTFFKSRLSVIYLISRPILRIGWLSYSIRICHTWSRLNKIPALRSSYHKNVSPESVMLIIFKTIASPGGWAEGKKRVFLDEDPWHLIGYCLTVNTVGLYVYPFDFILSNTHIIHRVHSILNVWTNSRVIRKNITKHAADPELLKECIALICSSAIKSTFVTTATHRQHPALKWYFNFALILIVTLLKTEI